MIGVFLCVCPNALATKAAADRLKKAVGAANAKGRVVQGPNPVRIEAHAGLCAASGAAFIAAKVKERGMDAAIVAGCQLLYQEDVVPFLAKASGLPSSRIFPVALRSSASMAGQAIPVRRAVAALRLMPPIGKRRVTMEQRVLVIGSGEAGRSTASRLSSLGHEVTVIEQAAPAESPPTPRDLSRATESLFATRLEDLRGIPGDYQVKLVGPDGAIERRFGAVVAATGVELSAGSQEPVGPGRVVKLPDLLAYLGGLRARQRPRSLGIVLDQEVDEGIASSAEAFRICLDLRCLFPSIEVSLIVRDVKVARLGLERLYDEVRESGVTVVKHTGRLRLSGGSEGRQPGRDASGGTQQVPDAPRGIAVRLHDEIAGQEVTLAFDLVAVSPWGVSAPADGELARILALDRDPQGHLQADNVRCLLTKTNRQGVFVVGACRGETGDPGLALDAADAASAIHELLVPKRMEVELGHAIVDGDKCALCLTCVRTCPAKAMRIDAAERRADCIPEACRRCGICAAECPNKAIRLPAWTDEVVMALAGADGVGATIAGTTEGGRR